MSPRGDPSVPESSSELRIPRGQRVVHRGAPSPRPLPPGPLKPACTPPSPRLTEPKQSCLTVEQAERLQGSWAWDQAVPHSFIHSFVHPTSVQAPTVCQLLFSVLGILLRLGRTHTALFPMLVVSTLGWGSLGSQGRLLSLSAHAHWA